eukprot:GILI01027622.1.p1 GENE.GILI01027622.1~~GILI01027622.1.p1  ORF type:complete len:264 (+),score=51.75 GILI01027622.1:59-793(+)
MDSDDDLIVAPRPPPKQAAISLDDSDDELMMAKPAVTQPPAAPEASGKAIVFEDSDDDLLPPNPNQAASPKSATPSSPVFHQDPQPQPSTAAASTKGINDAAVAEMLNSTRTFVKKQLNKEGFLSKLQPTWPYSPQRRWCVLEGRMFSYYDSQGALKPSATLDLKGAEIILDPKGAREPNSFGIANLESGSSGNGGASALKGRVFIFSTLTKEEMMDWVNALRSVLNDGHSEVHWFEKMAQGTF